MSLSVKKTATWIQPLFDTHRGGERQFILAVISHKYRCCYPQQTRDCDVRLTLYHKLTFNKLRDVIAKQNSRLFKSLDLTVQDKIIQKLIDERYFTDRYLGFVSLDGKQCLCGTDYIIEQM